MEYNERINVRGVGFDNVDMDEAVERVRLAMAGEAPQTAVFTPNAEIVQRCVDSPEYMAAVNSAELVIPDGIGVIKAARILGTPLKRKVPGIELGERVLGEAAARGDGVFLLGGKKEADVRFTGGRTVSVAQLAAEKIRERHPEIVISGVNDGYFDKNGAENDAVVEKINASGASVLYVCLGVPHQENWICKNRARLPGVRVLLALGGSLDGYAGIAKRAPRIFIRLGLEWFYRLCREPSRIGRMMSLPKFYFGTWLYKLKK